MAAGTMGRSGQLAPFERAGPLLPRPTSAALGPSPCTLLKPWGKAAILSNRVHEAAALPAACNMEE